MQVRKSQYEDAITSFPASPNHHNQLYALACAGVREGIQEAKIKQDMITCQSMYGKNPVNNTEIDAQIDSAKKNAWIGHNSTSRSSYPSSYSPVPKKTKKEALKEAKEKHSASLVSGIKERTKAITDPFATLSGSPDHVAGVIGIDAIAHLFDASAWVYIGALCNTPRGWGMSVGKMPIMQVSNWKKWIDKDKYIQADDTAFFVINPLRDKANRKADNVASYPYILIEMDEHDLETQARIILSLRDAGVKVVSVVKSGNKSLHTLIKIEGITCGDDYKHATEEIIKKRLSLIGADPACCDPSRMSRLHGATPWDTAKGKRRNQEVVYLMRDAYKQTGSTLDEILKALDSLGLSDIQETTAPVSTPVLSAQVPYVYNLDGKAILSLDCLVGWLTSEGYCQEACEGGNARYIHVCGNVYDVVSLAQIQTHVFEHIAKFGNPLEREEVLKNRKSIDDVLLRALPTRDITPLRDVSDTILFPYKNGMVCVTAGEVKIMPYTSLQGVINKKEIIDRDYVPGVSPIGSDFDKFLSLIMGGDSDRKDELCSAIGYLLSRYKNPGCPKAILLTDMSKEDNHGGTGKGMIFNAISLVRKNGYTIDGKGLENENKMRFAFSGVTKETQIVHFDDLTKKFQLEKLFPAITGEWACESKGIDNHNIPFTESPKMILSTNYWIRGVEDSFKRRVNIYELTNYFSAKRTPKDVFGHLFFGSDWDEKEWQKFDNTMIACAQIFLQSGLLTATPSEESKIKTLRAECGEAFCDWIAEQKIRTDGSFISNDFFASYFGNKEPSQADKLKMKKMMKKWAELQGYVYEAETGYDAENVRARGFRISPPAPAPVPPSVNTEEDKKKN